jgi:hypothetical protein
MRSAVVSLSIDEYLPLNLGLDVLHSRLRFSSAASTNGFEGTPRPGIPLPHPIVNCALFRLDLTACRAVAANTICLSITRFDRKRGDAATSVGGFVNRLDVHPVWRLDFADAHVRPAPLITEKWSGRSRGIHTRPLWVYERSPAPKPTALALQTRRLACWPPVRRYR